PSRQAGLFLGHLRQLRRENDAAGVAGPMIEIKASVVFREVRIAAVAENAFHEIQIADEVAGREETNLHRLLRDEAWNFGTDNRPQQQGNETLGGMRLRGREGQTQDLAWRMESGGQHFSEGSFRHGNLVVGNGQAPFRDLENSLRRAAVA